jgi:hypothetical protein
VNDERRPSPEPVKKSLKGIARASGLVLGLRWLERKQLGDPHPEVVGTGPKVDHVNEVADALAEAGREDDQALQELRAAAGGKMKVLKRALAVVRMGPAGSLSDSREGDRAERLLTAALTGKPIQQVSPEQEAWFHEIDALTSGGFTASYARLESQIPELSKLEAEVVASVEANRVDPVGTPLDDEWWEQVCIRLEELLNRESSPILRSGAAYGVAHRHLGDLANILPGEAT